ncbi:hypothetical protein [Thiorhodococcus minor]|uniref:hypothetical protein n=1 Tax=Thiorhodococcus minor TaxID=57489 RepID=UPI001ADCC5F6|nr:hypothetical protein [Thiorhodococcus minor]
MSLVISDGTLQIVSSTSPGSQAVAWERVDIAWLRDESEDIEERLTEPEDIDAAITGHLRAELEEIEGLTEEMDQAQETAA